MPNDWPGPNVNVTGSVITMNERCRDCIGKNVNNRRPGKEEQLRGTLEWAVHSPLGPKVARWTVKG